MSSMPAPSSFVPVTVAPYALDIDAGRFRLTVGHGSSIADIVSIAFPDLPSSIRERVSVKLVTARSIAKVEPANWHLVRPKPATQIVIAMTPGKGALQLLVSVAALAAAAIFAPYLAPMLGIETITAQSMIAAGVNMVGGLLLNAIFAQKEKKDRPMYAVTGWKNEARPEEVTPFILGTVRHAPPVGASTYMEVVRDQMWTRQIFCHGPGPVLMWDHKEGDDEIVADKNLQIEHRSGYPDDAPLTLYTNQVIEEPVGTEMVWLYKRDDAGKQLGVMDDLEPVKKTTGRRCKRAIIILRWTMGLGYVSQSGSKKAQAIVFSLRYRAAGSPTWVAMPDVTVSKRKFAEFWSAIPIDFPAVGAYEIELTRKTRSELPENAEASLISDCTWAVLQTHREEYPINVDVPLALTAIRARGTHKRSGVLDSYNCMIQRVTSGFGVGWPTNKPSNPATSALVVLTQQGALVDPRPSAEIDWDFFTEWRTFCDAKGLKFDIAGYEPRLEDFLKIIGAAGRASIFFDGSKWTGIIDRPRETPIDLITPHNAEGFSYETAYFNLPDAFRIKFADATNDYEEAERVVRRPGHVGAIVKTETIDFPGKTDPDEIYREAVRRFYELQHRNTVYRARMDDMKRSASRGDKVIASVDMLRREMASGRVVAVRGRQVELDEEIAYIPGVDYAARWRRPAAEDGSDTGHEIRSIKARTPGSFTFVFTADGPVPAPGDIVAIGEALTESVPLILAGIRRSKDMTSELIMLPSAEIIEALTDATPIPPWDPKVGEIIDLSGVAPMRPRIESVSHDTATGLTTVRVTPNPEDVIQIANYELGHRMSGVGGYTSVPIAAAAAQAEIAGYAIGDLVDLRVRATSVFGATGLYSDVATVTIAAIPAPEALPEESVQILGKLGQAEITFATAADPNINDVAIYRDGVVLPARVPVSPSGTFGRIDGDSTRTDLVVNGEFDVDADWTKGGNWSIAGGVATKAPGGTTDIRQAIAGMTAGRAYRGAVTVSGRTAGTLTPRIAGSTNVNGTAIAANGRILFRIVAGPAPANLVFLANATFDGSIDDVVLYEETAACLSQGSHTYQLEPHNIDDVPGPKTALRSVTVV